MSPTRKSSRVAAKESQRGKLDYKKLATSGDDDANDAPKIPRVGRARKRVLPSSTLLPSRTCSNGKYTSRLPGYVDEFSDAEEKPTVEDIEAEPIDEIGDNLMVVIKDEVEISEDIKVEVEWDESTTTTKQGEEMEVGATMEEDAGGVEVEASVGPISPQSDLDCTGTDNESEERFFPLLSLDGKDNARIRNLLLSYVGGQSALNLRKVCSTTKRWIDDLAEPQAKRIFAKSTATVELRGILSEIRRSLPFPSERPPQTLNRFFNYPPPSPVTSLSIINYADYIYDESHEEEPSLYELLNRFVDYWCLKLESLQLTGLVDKNWCPSTSPLYLLLSCPTLRRVQVDYLVNMHAEIPSWRALHPLVRLDLNDNDNVVDVALIDAISLTFRLCVALSNFIRLLSANPIIKSVDLLNLVRVDSVGLSGFRCIPTCSNVLLKALTAFIRSKEEDSDFKLTLGIKNIDIGKKWEDWLSFVSAVEASKSSIRILQMPGVRFKRLFNDQDLEMTPPETFSTFFSKIESIVGLSPASLIDGSLLQVPNLRQLEIVKYPGEELKPSILGPRYPYPKPGPFSLYERGFRYLPKGLESVTFTQASCSVTYLKDLLIKLDQQCPSLKELCLEWTCTDSSIEMPYCWCRENEANSSAQDLNSCIPFKNLQSFTFKIAYKNTNKYRVPCNLNGVLWILFDVLKIDHLSLVSLTLDFLSSKLQHHDDDDDENDEEDDNDFKSYTAVDVKVMNLEAIERLFNGPLPKSLESLQIGNNFVSEDALNRVKKLEEDAKANRKNRLSRFGST